MVRPKSIVMLSTASIVVILALAGFSGLLEFVGLGGAGAGGGGDSRDAGSGIEEGQNVPAEGASDPAAGERKNAGNPASAADAETAGETAGETAAETANKEVEPPPPPWSKRPVRVEIRGRDYFVGDEVLAIEAILGILEKIPEGTGPAIVIARAETSRASAEESLKRMLVERGVAFEWVE